MNNRYRTKITDTDAGEVITLEKEKIDVPRQLF